MYFKERGEENTQSPITWSQLPWDTCLHLDGTPSNGPHSFAHKVDIHLCGILLQFCQNLLKIHEANNH